MWTYCDALIGKTYNWNGDLLRAPVMQQELKKKEWYKTIDSNNVRYHQRYFITFSTFLKSNSHLTTWQQIKHSIPMKGLRTETSPGGRGM